MTIDNKDINGILADYHGLTFYLKTHTDEGQKLTLNIRNIQTILSDYKSKIITITMNSSDKYEIKCGRSLNKRHEEIMRIYQNFENRLTPKEMECKSYCNAEPCRY